MKGWQVGRVPTKLTWRLSPRGCRLASCLSFSCSRSGSKSNANKQDGNACNAGQYCDAMHHRALSYLQSTGTPVGPYGRLPCPSPFPAHFLNVQPSFSIPLPLDFTHGNLGQEVSPNLTSMIPYASWEYEQKLDR